MGWGGLTGATCRTLTLTNTHAHTKGRRHSSTRCKRTILLLNHLLHQRLRLPLTPLLLPFLLLLTFLLLHAVSGAALRCPSPQVQRRQA